MQKQPEKEIELFELLSTVTGEPASTFSSKWREPTLSIHSVGVSGPGSTVYPFMFFCAMLKLFLVDATVIPSSVQAKISLRIVPDQDLAIIVKSLKERLQSFFDGMNSPNKLSVSRSWHYTAV